MTQTASGLPAAAQVAADDRFLEYLIDFIPVLVVGGLARSAVAGTWFGIAYFLLRDVTGASFGKRVLHLRVVGKDGRPASVLRLIARNIVVALPSAGFLIAPHAGDGMLGLLARVGPLVLTLIDSGYLLQKGERYSDHLAGTSVRQAPPPSE